MSETQTEATIEPVEADPIEVIHKAECPSLSGRSTLEFNVGRHTEDGTLHLAVTGNSGKGMVCHDWVPATKINEIVIGELELTGPSFQAAQPGRSINFGSFAKAICIELGLVTANEFNARHASHIGGMTFEKAVAAYMASHEAAPTKLGRRKAKEV